MTDADQLPPLPEPEGVIVVGTQALRAFTAYQMRTYALQAIALRPVQVPMTDAQRTASWFGSPVDASWAAEDAYNEGIQDAEAHHGITAQAKKESHEHRSNEQSL